MYRTAVIFRKISPDWMNQTLMGLQAGVPAVIK